MALKEIKIKRHDLQPYVKVQMIDSEGTAIPNLDTATIVFTMVRLDEEESSPKIDRQSAGVNVTDAANAYVEYRWQSGDTDTSGRYSCEFEVTPVAGGKFTLPADDQDPLIVLIADDLDDT